MVLTSMSIISIGALLYFQGEFKSSEGIHSFAGRAKGLPTDTKGSPLFWQLQATGPGSFRGRTEPQQCAGFLAGCP